MRKIDGSIAFTIKTREGALVSKLATVLSRMGRTTGVKRRYGGD
ncbi:hypothetical protein [Candidatus Williamhamiltonella defendens]|nr:hypothetical protein [Candidatus Hamiltonella defensa]